MLGACHGAKRDLSVAIAEADDGRVLLHCFGGCTPQQIVGALGLQIEDLFPPRPAAPGQGKPAGPARPYSVGDMLRALRRELQVAWVVLADVAAGRELTDTDRRRAAVARERCAALITELSDGR